MLLTERDVRELAGKAVDTDAFPRPHQYGPMGLMWLEGDVRKWLEKRPHKKKVHRPKDDGESVETRPAE